MTTLLVLFSVTVVAIPANSEIITFENNCQLWTTLQNDSCKCGGTAFHLVSCEDKKGATGVTNCYCMTADKNNVSLVGACYFACPILSTYTKYPVYANTTQSLEKEICGPYKRTGVLCGECIEGYGLPVYSYSLSCVECSHYKYNWLKYIAVAYIPLTAFYVAIILFRVSATSGLLVAYTTVCQMISVKGIVALSLENLPEINVLKYFASLVSIWNLDFFRSLYSPFCLHPKLSALHVFMLDYAVALYPLILILLTYLAVKLHDQFSLVVWLCKPLTACLLHFRKEWRIKNSLVEAFTTFYILSFVKVLNTSADILKPVNLIDMNSNKKTSFFHDPALSYFGENHYPYAIVAIAFFVIYNILPLLLLCLYPCRCFHRCLNKTGCRWQALHVFMDAILGSYSHKPRERRYFGTVYITLRILHLIVFSVNFSVYLPAASYIVITAIGLVFIFKPYRNKWHNVIDVVLFSALLHCYLMFIFLQDIRDTDVYLSKLIVSHIYRISLIIALTILPIYGSIAILATILPKILFKRLLGLLAKIWRTEKSQLNESLPYRMEHSERE